MKTNSIVFKIFISIMLLCIIFINISMIMQTLLLDNYYSYRKNRSINEDIINIDNVRNNDFEGYIDYLRNTNNYELQVIDHNGDGIDILNKGIGYSDSFIEGKTKILNEYGKDKNSDIKYIDFLDEYNNVEKRAYLSPYIKELKGHMIVVDSIVIRKDVKDTIQYFFLLVFFSIIMVASILSYLYSRLIARPLIEMDRIAKQIANLDFSKSLDISSDDEIGSLADSLNTLSRNLEASLNQLKENNKRLKYFTANISHELKTPLTIISGYIEGIQDGIYRENQEVCLNAMSLEVQKMNTMIGDMLSLFRVESNDEKLSKESFSISKLAIEIQESFNPQISKLEYNYNSFIDKDLYVDANRKQIARVLTNLFTNAIKYTDKYGEINFKVSATKENEVYVAVENRTTNLSDEELTMVWDRFYRIDKSRNKRISGAGLGLSIVSAILKQHDSKYGVKNTDLGLEFYFILPRK